MTEVVSEEFPYNILHLSKPEAADRQIEAAIDAWYRGDFDIAITLAGAGEGMMLHRNTEFLNQLWERRPAGMEKPEAIRNMRLSRDWLKHTNASHSDHRIFTFFESGYFIALGGMAAGIETKKRDFIEAWLVAFELISIGEHFSEFLCRIGELEGGNSD